VEGREKPLGCTNGTRSNLRPDHLKKTCPIATNKKRKKPTLPGGKGGASAGRADNQVKERRNTSTGKRMSKGEFELARDEPRKKSCRVELRKLKYVKGRRALDLGLGRRQNRLQKQSKASGGYRGLQANDVGRGGRGRGGGEGGGGRGEGCGGGGGGTDGVSVTRGGEGRGGRVWCEVSRGWGGKGGRGRYEWGGGGVERGGE